MWSINYDSYHTLAQLAIQSNETQICYGGNLLTNRTAAVAASEHCAIRLFNVSVLGYTKDNRFAFAGHCKCDLLVFLIAYEQAAQQWDFGTTSRIGAWRGPRPQVTDDRLAVFTRRVEMPNTFARVFEDSIDPVLDITH